MEAKLIAAKNGDEHAMYQIIEENDGLIRFSMKKYFKETFDEDLHSMGVLTMIKAVKSYTVGHEVKFSSYACACLNNTYLREFQRRITPKYQALNNSISIHSEVKDTLTYQDIIEDNMAQREIEDSIMPKVTDFLHVLNDKERIVFEMKYIQKKKRDEIAAALGIKPTSVARPLQSMKSKLAYELGIEYHNSYENESKRKREKYAKAKADRGL